VQFAKDKELWNIPELPEGKAMLSILYLILLAGLALLTITSTWLEYQTLSAGPLVSWTPAHPLQYVGAALGGAGAPPLAVL
jgi:hypothetical protein